MNVNKSKVKVFGRSKSEVANFDCPYRLKVECPKECNIKLNGERMEEVNEFKYLGSILCKHGSMEGETRERAVQGKKMIGFLELMMKVRTVDMKVKKGLHDGIIVPTITYESET